MSRRGRAGFNQYVRGDGQTSRMSTHIQDYTQVNSLDDTLHLQPSHLQDAVAPIATSRSSLTLNFVTEQYGLALADHEATSHRYMKKVLGDLERAHAEYLDTVVNVRTLTEKTQEVAKSTERQRATNNVIFQALDRVVDMKQHFYGELDSIKEQLHNMEQKEQQKVEALTTELDQLRADYDACCQINVIQVKDISEAQAQLQTVSIALGDANQSIEKLTDEKEQLQMALNAASDSLIDAQEKSNTYCKSLEDLETLLSRSIDRERQLLKELEGTRDIYEQIEKMSKELIQRRRATRRLKLRTSQLRRHALLLKESVQKSAARASHDSELVKQRDSQISAIMREVENYKKQVQHNVSAYECKISKQKDTIRKLSASRNELQKELNSYKLRRERTPYEPIKVMNASTSGKSICLSMSDSCFRSEVGSSRFMNTLNRCAIM